MKAIGNLTFEDLQLVTRPASHTAASVGAILRTLTADQLPGGRNTKAEVERRFGPVSLESFLRKFSSTSGRNSFALDPTFPCDS